MKTKLQFKMQNAITGGLEAEFSTGVQQHIARIGMELDLEDNPTRLNLSAMIITLNKVDMVIGLLQIMKAQSIALQQTKDNR